ncbi:hypothetical protein [Flavobacterium tegetincola]|uniref:hypothetical protein n=1 Tax=Flavobacterium tegetincola TaxID=150172 RepID=UPI00040E388B|nr:hypothetical protein [Flavobacterium tegetincola]
MEMSKILEILVALALFYFLFSSLVSVVFEWYSYQTQKRGKFLYQSIIKLLNDPVNQSYGATLYAHFSIDRLKKSKDFYPPYISSDLFADALIDVIGSQSDRVYFDNPFASSNKEAFFEVKMQEQRITEPFVRFGEGLACMHYSPLKNQLRFYFEKSSTYAELHFQLKTWYDDYMSRASGWYKNKTKTSLYIISFMVCVGFNLDSITVVKKINRDDALRKKMMVVAERTVDRENKSTDATAEKKQSFAYPTEDASNFTMDSDKKRGDEVLNEYLRIELQLRELEDNALPIGYYGYNSFLNIFSSLSSFLWWLLGLLISTLALSFGAPFWFEVMAKAINIRRSGVKPN